MGPERLFNSPLWCSPTNVRHRSRPDFGSSPITLPLLPVPMMTWRGEDPGMSTIMVWTKSRSKMSCDVAW